MWVQDQIQCTHTVEIKIATCTYIVELYNIYIHVHACSLHVHMSIESAVHVIDILRTYKQPKTTSYKMLNL